MDMINKCDLMHETKQNEEARVQIERSRETSEIFDRNIKYNKLKESQ